jgi:phospholipid transport system substrate-binding protein
MLRHITIARRHLLAIAAGGLMLIGANGLTAGARADDQAVLDFVNTLSNKTLEELAHQQTDADRVAKLKPILQQYFDMPGISKYVLGGYWRKATPQQQQDFVEAFTNYISVSYGKRFGQYSGHKMDIKRVHDDGDGHATAYTIVQVEGQDPTRVDWIIDTVNNSFHILDLRVEGLSLADTHRQEFASVIQNNGGSVQKLIDILQQKAKL